ncbi:MAG: winged helix-turn-helix transcriptional regulator [Candidatus Thorarchaeota archaeon]|nr:winged helix-turn-helix transcriptional regulator [Candidatus Thorarchaeota archaeon]
MAEDADAIVGLLGNSSFEILINDSVNSISKAKGRDLKRLDLDVLVVVGSDRTLLNTLLSIGEESIPILPVASRGHPSFLFDVSATGFEQVVIDLDAKKWSKETRARLVATISEKRTAPILNEVAIFSRRSATLLTYSLHIGGELFWEDGSDGIIVSTPTGSTAYSMSGGGPIVFHPASVFSVVPVNSSNPERKPIIVPDDTPVEIKGISSSVTVEAVLDGQTRVPVKNSDIRIERSEFDAVFVKFTEERVAALSGKLLRKAGMSSEITQELPPSAKLVLKVLEYHGTLSQKRITDETNLPSRTVRYALSLLVAEGVVKKQISLRDTRQAIYSLVQGTIDQ